MKRLFNSHYEPFKNIFNDMNMKKFLVNITENENSFFVDAELPGFKKEEIKISIEDNLLSIKAEKDEKKLERSFQVRKNIIIDKIKATLENGILSINLNKSTKNQPEKISIN